MTSLRGECDLFAKRFLSGGHHGSTAASFAIRTDLTAHAALLQESVQTLGVFFN